MKYYGELPYYTRSSAALQEYIPKSSLRRVALMCTYSPRAVVEGSQPSVSTAQVWELLNASIQRCAQASLPACHANYVSSFYLKRQGFRHSPRAELEERPGSTLSQQKCHGMLVGHSSATEQDWLSIYIIITSFRVMIPFPPTISSIILCRCHYSVTPQSGCGTYKTSLYGLVPDSPYMHSLRLA